MYHFTDIRVEYLEGEELILLVIIIQSVAM